MSVAEETIKDSVQAVGTKKKPEAKKKSKPIVNRILDLLSSVRFGIILLVALVVLSMIGMLIVQQNVDGFDRFYASMTPAEKLIYGYLGLFDVYHAWYYNLLLLILSLNIVLASIDRFPTAWNYIAKPKIEATKAYLLNQPLNSKLYLGGSTDNNVSKVESAFRKFGFKPKVITKDTGRKIIFAQRNAWNRLGAYIVHVALLTLFLGHFVALQTGYDADVQLTPGRSTNQIQLINFNLDKQERSIVPLPFTLTCTDIEQKLIDPNGSIQVNNTLDWATRMKITDPTYGDRNVSVSLNQPYTYRGYRFFQASTITQGSARMMILKIMPDKGEPFEVKLPRNGSTALPDGTKVEYLEFFADFAFVGGKPDNRSSDYNNPAVQLKITNPQGESKVAYAFSRELPSGAPVGGAIFGNKYRLAEFEKAPLAHILSIKYDPFYGSTIAWYWGGGLLIFSLFAVFFFAHQRIWAIVEPDGEVVLGGQTNRNEFGFDDKFKKIIGELS